MEADCGNCTCTCGESCECDSCECGKSFTRLKLEETPLKNEIGTKDSHHQDSSSSALNSLISNLRSDPNGNGKESGQKKMSYVVPSFPLPSDYAEISQDDPKTLIQKSSQFFPMNLPPISMPFVFGNPHSNAVITTTPTTNTLNVNNHSPFSKILTLQAKAKSPSNQRESEDGEEQDDYVKQRRERNCAASARARLKKKKRIDELEKSNRELALRFEKLLKENQIANARILMLEQKIIDYEAAFLLLKNANRTSSSTFGDGILKNGMAKAKNGIMIASSLPNGNAKESHPISPIVASSLDSSPPLPSKNISTSSPPKSSRFLSVQDLASYSGEEKPSCCKKNGENG